MPEENPTVNDVEMAFRRQILEALEDSTHPPHLLQLAEAWAWIKRPDQSHGGSSVTS